VSSAATRPLMILVAERVLARCDAPLRIGGPSEGADHMVAVARQVGEVVFTDPGQVP
jgi:hypothetical protein